jgi:hypothetical protein
MDTIGIDFRAIRLEGESAIKATIYEKLRKRMAELECQTQKAIFPCSKQNSNTIAMSDDKPLISES